MKKLTFLLFLFLSYNLFSQTYQANWASIDSRQTPKWFEDAKFGIFIHWGLFSVPAWGPTKEVGVYDRYAEWYWYKLMDANSKVNPFFTAFHNKTYGKDFKYPDFVKGFNCEMFNPDDWAEILKGSGAKYVVLTSKHHEGFTLWPSAQAWNWNSVDVGPHRDLAGDLSKSVKASGLKMGFYYSLYEWFNPLYKSDVSKYVNEHMIPQMKDLVTRYQPEVLWTDGEWEHPSETWKSTEFLTWLFNESSVKNSIVVNDRWGKETRSKHGGFYTTEYDLIGDDNVQKKKIEHCWEECRGIGGSFGYNRNENLSDYSSSAKVIHTLIEKVSGGGNLLLNIGPTADGRIPVIMQQRLKDIGDWLKINGEAIYETRAWKNAPKKMPDIYYTTKNKDLYIICTHFPDKKIIIDGLKNSGRVSLLGLKENIKSNINGGKLTITPPQLNPNTNPCNHAWVFKVENAL